MLGAAAVQGVTFKVTRAAVDRAGANGFAHLTGFWPGEKAPDDERGCQGRPLGQSCAEHRDDGVGVPERLAPAVSAEAKAPRRAGAAACAPSVTRERESRRARRRSAMTASRERLARRRDRAPRARPTCAYRCASSVAVVDHAARHPDRRARRSKVDLASRRTPAAAHAPTSGSSPARGPASSRRPSARRAARAAVGRAAGRRRQRQPGAPRAHRRRRAARSRARRASRGRPRRRRSRGRAAGRAGGPSAPARAPSARRTPPATRSAASCGEREQDRQLRACGRGRRR